MAGKSSDLWARAAFFAALSAIIPGGALAGYFIGRFLDHRVHTGQILSVAGIFVGTAAGIVEVIQLFARAEKNASKPPGRDDPAN